MVVAAILLSVAPFFFPVLLQLLGLLTGVIQAYIFAVLAMVYIVSASGQEAGAAESRTLDKGAGSHNASKERNI